MEKSNAGFYKFARIKAVEEFRFQRSGDETMILDQGCRNEFLPGQPSKSDLVIDFPGSHKLKFS